MSASWKKWEFASICQWPLVSWTLTYPGPSISQHFVIFSEWLDTLSCQWLLIIPTAQAECPNIHAHAMYIWVQMSGRKLTSLCVNLTHTNEAVWGGRRRSPCAGITSLLCSPNSDLSSWKFSQTNSLLHPHVIFLGVERAAYASSTPSTSIITCVGAYSASAPTCLVTCFPSRFRRYT